MVKYNRKFGIPDEAFVRTDIPMTKAEVRAITLSKLCIEEGMDILDIGCGTGSVSVECGRLAYRGTVYAMDQKTEAVELTKQNFHKFNIKNGTVVQGKAPIDLPKQKFDRIFLGGGSKNVESILEYSLEHLKDRGVFVANTILLDSTYRILQGLKSYGFINIDCSMVQITRVQEHPGWMMQGMNPVYIISAEIDR